MTSATVNGGSIITSFPPAAFQLSLRIAAGRVSQAEEVA